MSDTDHNSKVTVEDLLRLKRTERPSPEFWLNFERELREKQLTALVKKRHWWHQLPLLLSRRAYLPVGATAIVAFTMVTMRFSTPAQIVQLPNTAPQIVAVDPAVETLPVTVISVSDQGRSARYEEARAIASVPALAAIATLAPDVVASASDNTVTQQALSTSSHPLVTNLARLEQQEPDLADSIMGSRLSSTARVQSVVVQSEVAAMTTASTNKYQLIARYADRSLSPAPAAPALVRERLARRLGDDLSDSISRIGVVGDRVSLKF